MFVRSGVNRDMHFDFNPTNKISNDFMCLGRGFRKVFLRSDSLWIVSIFSPTEITKESFPMYAVLILEWFHVQYFSNVLFPFDLINFYNFFIN